MLVWPEPALCWLPDQAFFMGPRKPGPYCRSALEAPRGTAEHARAGGVWSGASPQRVCLSAFLCSPSGGETPLGAVAAGEAWAAGLSACSSQWREWGP